ncbi:protein phosphatase 2C domain-containing protein [Streptomyces sp. NPDC090306]|uniref:protein phosphatase 2C domain-containing protein n=1 Tax=unclassified Streptomyces TaxID=2593676 RepID=UPI0036EEAE1C
MPAPEEGTRDEGAAVFWRPLVVGTPLPRFEPRPPSGLSYRPDTVCDGWSTSALDLRLASVRGYQHRYDGRPREDDAAAAWEHGTGTVVFAVADGVSDAQQPHIGAQLACRSAVDEMLAQVRGGDGFVADWEKLLSTVHWQLVEQARRILHDPDAGARETAGLLATTLVAGTATPTQEGVLVHLVCVGDSGAWQIKHDRFYSLLGGKSAGADGLVSSAVEPLPYVPAGMRPFCFRLEPGTVLLVGTDGFGDALGDGTGAVAGLFLNRLRDVVPPLGFAHLLDFSRETFDDDRTLLALWPRDRAGGGPL